MNFLKLVFSTLLLAALVACGGGGGSPGIGGGGSSGTSGGSSLPSLVTAILNSSGAVVTTLASGEAYSARAVVLDASGVPVVGKSVTFLVSSAIATLSPASALTDASGVATVAIVPLSSGAASLSASATIGTSTATGQSDFAVSVAGTSGQSAVKASILNSSNVSVNSIAVGGSYTARAIVTDATGTAVVGKLVTFSASSAIASLNPTSALTNSLGVAAVSIAPASIASAGAATLITSATVAGVAVSDQVDFAVSASSLSLSAITAGSTTLTSGGNTSLSVTALISGGAASTTPVSVTFTASCGRINGIDTSAGVTTNGSGVAAATYSAVASDGSPCSGAVTLLANSVGATSGVLTLSVAAPVANAITFTSATPAQIYVKGSGSVEQSLLKFKVFTSTGAASANTAVAFSVANNPGGVTLSGSTGMTDSVGVVTVSVFSGTIPGPVKVRATLSSDGTVFAESQNLTVSSGPPSQRFMSLSVSTFSVEGENLDGVATTVTARLADRQGNPVEDGTVVNFTAEGGQVASSCATAKVNGISLCSVIWQSQNPRPIDGRVSILAFTAGTKDYIDMNGNNRYDAGVDTLIDIGEAYRDDNEDRTFNEGEFVLPLLGAKLPCPGSGGAFPARAGTCDGELKTTVRQQVIILNGSSTPVIRRTNTGAASLDFTLSSANHVLLPMPAGTAVTALALDNTSENGLTCSVGTILNAIVPDVLPGIVPTASLITSHVVGLKDCAGTDRVEVKVTTPSGRVTSQIFTL